MAILSASDVSTSNLTTNIPGSYVAFLPYDQQFEAEVCLGFCIDSTLRNNPLVVLRASSPTANDWAIATDGTLTLSSDGTSASYCIGGARRRRATTTPLGIYGVGLGTGLSNQSSSSSSYWVIGLVFGLCFLFILVILLVCFMRRRERSGKMRHVDEMERQYGLEMEVRSHRLGMGQPRGAQSPSSEGSWGHSSAGQWQMEENRLSAARIGRGPSSASGDRINKNVQRGDSGRSSMLVGETLQERLARSERDLNPVPLSHAEEMTGVTNTMGMGWFAAEATRLRFEKRQVDQQLMQTMPGSHDWHALQRQQTVLATSIADLFSSNPAQFSRREPATAAMQRQQQQQQQRMGVEYHVQTRPTQLYGAQDAPRRMSPPDLGSYENKPASYAFAPVVSLKPETDFYSTPEMERHQKPLSARDLYTNDDPYASFDAVGASTVTTTQPTADEIEARRRMAEVRRQEEEEKARADEAKRRRVAFEEEQSRVRAEEEKQKQRKRELQRIADEQEAYRQKQAEEREEQQRQLRERNRAAKNPAKRSSSIDKATGYELDANLANEPLVFVDLDNPPEAARQEPPVERHFGDVSASRAPFEGDGSSDFASASRDVGLLAVPAAFSADAHLRTNRPVSVTTGRGGATATAARSPSSMSPPQLSSPQPLEQSSLPPPPPPPPASELQHQHQRLEFEEFANEDPHESTDNGSPSSAPLTRRVSFDHKGVLLIEKANHEPNNSTMPRRSILKRDSADMLLEGVVNAGPSQEPPALSTGFESTGFDFSNTGFGDDEYL
jgi:hypothetical protein